MHPSKLFTRRPSAAMVVALVALFAALGGAGYAATFIPRNSVGSAQLQNSSVTNHKIANGSVGNFKLAFGAVGPRKIINGAVGTSQINANQVQKRVTGVCQSGGVTSVGSNGSVTCGAAPGADFNSANPSPVALGSGATTIDSEALPGGFAYLVTANPYISIGGITASSNEQVSVTCTLTAGASTSATEIRGVTVDLGTNAQATTIPLSVAAPTTPSAITAAVACVEQNTGSVTPKVSVLTGLNGLQTASDTQEPYAG